MASNDDMLIAVFKPKVELMTGAKDHGVRAPTKQEKKKKFKVEPQKRRPLKTNFKYHEISDLGNPDIFNKTQTIIESIRQRNSVQKLLQNDLNCQEQGTTLKSHMMESWIKFRIKLQQDEIVKLNTRVEELLADLSRELPADLYTRFAAHCQNVDEFIKVMGPRRERNSLRQNRKMNRIQSLENVKAEFGMTVTGNTGGGTEYQKMTPAKSLGNVLNEVQGLKDQAVLNAARQVAVLAHKLIAATEQIKLDKERQECGVFPADLLCRARHGGLIKPTPFVKNGVGDVPSEQKAYDGLFPGQKMGSKMTNKIDESISLLCDESLPRQNHENETENNGDGMLLSSTSEDFKTRQEIGNVMGEKEEDSPEACDAVTQGREDDGKTSKPETGRPNTLILGRNLENEKESDVVLTAEYKNNITAKSKACDTPIPEHELETKNGENKDDLLLKSGAGEKEEDSPEACDAITPEQDGHGKTSKPEAGHTPIPRRNLENEKEGDNGDIDVLLTGEYKNNVAVKSKACDTPIPEQKLETKNGEKLLKSGVDPVGSKEDADKALGEFTLKAYINGKERDIVELKGMLGKYLNQLVKKLPVDTFRRYCEHCSIVPSDNNIDLEFLEAEEKKLAEERAKTEEKTRIEERANSEENKQAEEKDRAEEMEQTDENDSAEEIEQTKEIDSAEEMEQIDENDSAEEIEQTEEVNSANESAKSEEKEQAEERAEERIQKEEMSPEKEDAKVGSKREPKCQLAPYPNKGKRNKSGTIWQEPLQRRDRRVNSVLASGSMMLENDDDDVQWSSFRHNSNDDTGRGQKRWRMQSDSGFGEVALGKRLKMLGSYDETRSSAINKQNFNKMTNPAKSNPAMPIWDPTYFNPSLQAQYTAGILKPSSLGLEQVVPLLDSKLPLWSRRKNVIDLPQTQNLVNMVPSQQTLQLFQKPTPIIHGHVDSVLPEDGQKTELMMMIEAVSSWNTKLENMHKSQHPVLHEQMIDDFLGCKGTERITDTYSSHLRIDYAEDKIRIRSDVLHPECATDYSDCSRPFRSADRTCAYYDSEKPLRSERRIGDYADREKPLRSERRIGDYAGCEKRLRSEGRTGDSAGRERPLHSEGRTGDFTEREKPLRSKGRTGDYAGRETSIRSEHRIWDYADRERPLRSEVGTGDYADRERPPRSVGRTGDYADCKRPPRFKGRTGDYADRESPLRSEGRTGDYADRERPLRSEGRTGDYADRERPPRSEGRTCDYADRDRPLRSEGRTGDYADRDRPLRSESRTGDYADRERPPRSEGRTGDYADRERPPRSEGRTGNYADRERPLRSEGRTGDYPDRERPLRSEGRTGDYADRERPLRSEERSGDNADRKGPLRSKGRTGDYADRKRPLRSEERTGDNADRKGPLRSKDRTGDNADRKRPLRSKGRTGDNADRKGPLRSKGRTGIYADSKRPICSERKTSDYADHETSLRSELRIEDYTDRERPSRSEGRAHDHADRERPPRSESKAHDNADLERPPRSESRARDYGDRHRPPRSEGRAHVYADLERPPRSEGRARDYSDQEKPPRSEGRVHDYADLERPPRSEGRARDYSNRKKPPRFEGRTRGHADRDRRQQVF